MAGAFHPVAPTSDPNRARDEAQLGPMTFSEVDFSWLEDWVPRWRAIALFGGLTVVEGFALTIGLMGASSGSTLSVFGTMLGLAILLALGGIVAAVAGFGAEAVAAFASAGIGIGIPIFYTFPAGSAPTSTDFDIVGGLLAAGLLLLVIGVVKLTLVSRAIAEVD